MIRFEFERPDRGSTMEFSDVAAALVAAQDELDRWTFAIREAGGKVEQPIDEQAQGISNRAEPG